MPSAVNHVCRVARPTVLIALATFFALAGLEAQQTGTVTGSVTDARNAEPLSGVQVVLDGTQRGTLTGSEGRFTIEDVPTGTYTLAARLIGFGRLTQEVTVRAGETTTADFRLQQDAIGLEEIVVTGQAGQTRRREIGNAISEIDMSAVDESPTNFESLLQGRVAGLSVSEVSGSAGSGSTIRLRGNVSVSQSNQPLIYVDGVRIRSEGYPKNVPPVGYSGRSANISASPLNDIDPSAIERVEVIKGAAATTLYGTEASAGVIQIFTKEGSTDGSARWTARVDQSMDHTLQFGPDNEPHFGMDPWLRNSHGQNYSLSGRGGLEDVDYFLSGSYGDDKAPLPLDVEESYGVRGNIGFEAASDLRLQFNTSYRKRDITNTPSANNAHGLTLQVYRGDRNYVGSQEKEVIDQVLDYDITSGIDRFTSGLSAQFSPTGQMSHRFAIGYDRASTENRQVRPFGFILAPRGKMSNQRWTAETVTLDYSGSYQFEVASDLNSTFTAGGQVIRENETSTTGYAEDFPGPGEPTLSSGSLTLSFEDRIEKINAGFFLQNRFGWQDRLFLTAGLRVDGNSAFGEGLGLQTYPKLSASYVISDSDFWDDDWGTLKLRSAYGHSGRAPGAFDAVRTWEPVKLGTSPGFLPQNLGNAELGPERTQELEVGFDGTFADERLTAEFTWYSQQTTDALFPVRKVPSNGGWGSQLENVGELHNAGIELALNGSLIRGPDLSLDLGASLSTNHSEVVDLGDATQFQVGDAAYIQEGEPAPVIRGPVLTNPDEVADPTFEEETHGPNQPTTIVGVDTRVEAFGGMVLRARGEYLGGHYIEDGATENGISRAVRWPTCATENAMIDAGNGDQLTARQRADCISTATVSDYFIYPADFFKLREVSLRVPLSGLTTAVSNPTLTLSARNALRWINDDFPVFDPEMAGQVGHQAFVRQISEHVPPPATYTASVRFSF